MGPKEGDLCSVANIVTFRRFGRGGWDFSHFKAAETAMRWRSRSDSTALKILRNLRDKTVANPLAVGIVGAGMAWLMYSRGREARRPDEEPNLGTAGTFSGDAAKRAEERKVNLPPGL
jgi:hypothetical protein